jgi:hypothetical protein
MLRVPKFHFSEPKQRTFVYEEFYFCQNVSPLWFKFGPCPLYSLNFQSSRPEFQQQLLPHSSPPILFSSLLLLPLLHTILSLNNQPRLCLPSCFLDSFQRIRITSKFVCFNHT